MKAAVAQQQMLMDIGKAIMAQTETLKNLQAQFRDLVTRTGAKIGSYKSIKFQGKGDVEEWLKTYSIMSELDTANFRDWPDDAKLKHFLSALEREMKECIEVHLVQQSVDQSVFAARAALKERFKDKNKEVRNFNEELVLKQKGTVREYNQKFLKL